jgi:hypothetical protein
MAGPAHVAERPAPPSRPSVGAVTASRVFPTGRGRPKKQPSSDARPKQAVAAGAATAGQVRHREYPGWGSKGYDKRYTAW